MRLRGNQRLQMKIKAQPGRLGGARAALSARSSRVRLLKGPRAAIGLTEPLPGLFRENRLWLLSVLCFVFASSLLAEKSAPKGAKATNPSTAASKEKSVEALAETARQSVVVISHFGRDGKEDGIGAGFIVSSNGL